MASVRQIAKQAGVSITTVSRVLNSHPRVSDRARKRVLAAANKSRYIHTVGRRSTTNIAFVYTGSWSIGSTFDASLMQGMSAGMIEHDYDLLIVNAVHAKQAHETYTQMFLRKGARGAVLRTTAATRDVCVAIADEGFPAVVVADEFDEPNVNTVYADSRLGCRRALEHLLDLGHRRIAFTLNIVDDHDHQQRLDTYRQTLQAGGVVLDDRLILRVPAFREAGAMALRQIMSMRDRPTAVFMSDPMPALGLFQEAKRTGVDIPRQLSVIGFDDADLRLATNPRMSAVCENAEDLGREAFRLLDELIGGNDTPAGRKVKLECWLELHESTAPPGA